MNNGHSVSHYNLPKMNDKNPVEFQIQEGWIELADGNRIDKVYYRKVGHGPIILFLHGWLHSSLVWIPVMRILAARCTGMAIDLPGFGRSKFQNTRHATLNSLIDLIPRVITQLNSTGEIGAIVADSLSALTVLRFCSGNSRFNIPVLFSGYPSETLPFFIRLLAVTRLVRPALTTLRLLPRPLSALLIRIGCRFAVHTPGTDVSSIIESVLDADPRAAADLLQQINHSGARKTAGCVFPIRSLVLRGEFDMLANEKSSIALAQSLAAEYIEIPGSGHTPMLERPKAISDAVNRLLDTSGGIHG